MCINEIKDFQVEAMASANVLRWEAPMFKEG
jgi:hypothetical protein